jgi:multimeric flavodoxin WrbA
MRALIISGSRCEGFTSEMCRSFSNGLAAHDVSSTLIFPLEMDIEHCKGCGECSAGGKCIISDDMDAVYEEFGRSDLLVLATPIHFSGPSSIIKTVIDRFQPLWFKNDEHPSSAVALLCGGGLSPNFKNSLSIFRSFAITAGIEWLGQLEIPDTDNKNTPDVAEPAFDYGKEVGRIITEDRK